MYFRVHSTLGSPGCSKVNLTDFEEGEEHPNLVTDIHESYVCICVVQSLRIEDSISITRFIFFLEMIFTLDRLCFTLGFSTEV